MNVECLGDIVEMVHFFGEVKGARATHLTGTLASPDSSKPQREKANNHREVIGLFYKNSGAESPDERQKKWRRLSDIMMGESAANAQKLKLAKEFAPLALGALEALWPCIPQIPSP